MTGYPERYIVFDTESQAADVPAEHPTERLTLRLGVALIVDHRAPKGSRDCWHEFRSDEEFHDMIAGLPFTTDPIVVLAHNIGFDVRQVNWMWWLGQGRYSLTPPANRRGLGHYKTPLFIADSPPFIIRLWRPDGQQLLLLDSFQWFAVRLETLGEWIGEPKWERPAPDADEERWREYCRQDVEVLHGALRLLWAFLRERRIPDWAFTPAAQAMQIYRMRYEKKRLTRAEDPTLLTLDRHAYYGGIVEAFRLGEIPGPLYQLDVSSLYPFVMHKHDFPCRIESHGDYSAEPRIPDAFAPFASTAEVWLDSPVHPFPVRGSDQTCWCTGKVRTILCRPELERAWSLGVVRKVGRWVRYELANLFSDFVGDYWGWRSASTQQGRELDAQTCKILMNALHGKFGQRTGEWVAFGRTAEKGKYGSGLSCSFEHPGHSYYRLIDGIEFHMTPDQEDPRGFVPIAAWTASYARAYMWDMIHTAGIDHVYHVATDSLIVDGVGLGALQLAGFVEEAALGLFRVEGTAEKCVIHGANCVDWGAKKKRPGVKRGSMEEAPDIWRVPKWSGFIEDITREQFGAVTIQQLLYDMSRRYERRESARDGTTRPWHIDNWDVTPEAQSDMPIPRRRLGEVT